MKFKMRVLQYSKDTGAFEIATAIAKAQGIQKVDRIPPDYNLEGERLALVCVDCGKKADKSVVSFVNFLNTDRVKNVAFIGVGNGTADAMNELAGMAKATGINVVGITECAVKSGLFKKGKPTDADINTVLAWVDGIVNSLAN